MAEFVDFIGIEMDEGVYKTIHWPMCAVPGCKNRINRASKSKYCYPHANFTENIVLVSVIPEEEE
jgi:hypothetical protein